MVPMLILHSMTGAMAHGDCMGKVVVVVEGIHDHVIQLEVAFLKAFTLQRSTLTSNTAKEWLEPG